MSRHRSAWGLVLSAMLAAAGAVRAQDAGAYDDQGGISDPPRVRSIAFVGAEQMDAGELRQAMRLKQRSWWRPFRRNYFYGTDQLEPDLERVFNHYRSEGFLTAKIVSASVAYASRSWVDITIEVEEGPRFHVRSVSAHGLSPQVRAHHGDRLSLRVGAPLRERDLAASELDILESCSELGYALAEIDRELRLEGDSAAVLFWVRQGPLVRVGEIDAVGAARTDEDVVLREVALRSGRPLRLSRAERTQERLFDLGVFRSVRVLPQYDRIDPEHLRAEEVTVDLNVEVLEKAPGWYGLGFGYSSRDRVRMLGEWGYRNLGGRARRVQATGEIAYSLLEEPRERFRRPKEWEVELSYAAPWMFETPTRWQVRTYLRYKRWFEEEATLEEDIVGILLRARWDLSRYRRLIGSIENKWTTVDSTFVTRFLSLSYAEDRRDFILNPRSGRFIQARSEYAGGFLGGESDFTRWSVSLAGYIPLGSGFTWAHRVRGGYIHPLHVRRDATAYLNVPIDERYFAGGGTTVRGYEEESLGAREEGQTQSRGGLALLVLNAELRFRLFWRLGAAFFMDAGNVWADYEQITWSRFTRPWTHSDYSELDVAYGVGTGLRLGTPVGPLRLDYGFKIGRGHRRVSGSDSAWHLSLGQAF